MADNKYSVDDILEEIRRKKTAAPAAAEAASAPTAPKPDVREAGAPPALTPPLTTPAPQIQRGSAPQPTAPVRRAPVPVPQPLPARPAAPTAPVQPVHTAPTQPSQTAPRVTPVQPSQTAPRVAPVQPTQAAPRVAPVQPTQTAPRVTPVQPSQTAPRVTPVQPTQSAPHVAPVQPTQSAPRVAPTQVAPKSAPDASLEDAPRRSADGTGDRPGQTLSAGFLSRLRKPKPYEAPVAPAFTVNAERIDLPPDAIDRAPRPKPDPIATASTQDFEPVKPAPSSEFADRFSIDTDDVSVSEPTRHAGGAPILSGSTEAAAKYQFLQESRKEKVESFVLQNEPEQTGSEPHAPESVPESSAFEYTRPEDAPAIREYFRRSRSRLLVRMVVSGVAAFGLLLLALFPILDPAVDPRLYVVLPLILLLVSAGISYPVMGGGLVSLVKLRADSDSVTALAAVAAVAQVVVLLIWPGDIAVHSLQVFAVFPALTLFFNAVGKYFHLARVLNGFAQLTRDGSHHAVAVISRKLAAEFSQIAELDAPVAAVSVESDFLTDYLEIANTEDPVDRLSRTLCPVTLLGCIGVFALSFLFTKSAAIAVTSMTAAFAVCAPFTVVLCASLPMLLMNRRIRPRRAAVSGYAAVEEFEDVDHVVLNANDLFPDGSIVLHGIKTLGIDKIDDHILDAASIVVYSRSTLAPIFLQVIENKTDLLRPVDNVVVEDGMGLSGWVGGRRILVGNRDLLQNHGIDVPSRDYEAKYLKERRDIVYLATSGEISAMFVISYAADPAVESALARLLRANLSLLVRSTDPNITGRKLAQIFTFPVNMIRVIPGKCYADYRELTRKKSAMPATLLTDGSIPSLAAALTASRTIKKSLSLALLLQTLGLLLGFVAVAILSFTLFPDAQSMGQLSVGNLLLWQLLWLAASLGLPLLYQG